MPDEQPKLHVDSDWKAEARAEKDRLAADAAKTQADRGDQPRPGELPDPDFRGLVGVLASQAIMGLGAMGDPKTGRVIIDLPGAKFSIDLLTVLERTTKGNIEDDEAKELTQVLTELRARFVEISDAVARQGAAGAIPGHTEPPPDAIIG